MALTTAPDFADGIVTAAKLQQLSDAINQRTPLFALKDSNETVNNSNTYQDDDELLLSVEANLRYQGFCQVVFSSATAADYKMFLNLPSGATATDWSYVYQGTADIASASSGVIVPGSGVGSKDVLMWSGILTVGATAGAATWRWAQSVADATDTVVYAKSFFKLTRVT